MASTSAKLNKVRQKYLIILNNTIISNKSL